MKKFESHLVNRICINSVLLIMIALLAKSTFTQSDNYAKEQLNSALKDYKVRYDNLMKDRGILGLESRIEDNYISRLLKAYASKSNKYEQHLGVLYYHFQDNSLQVWLIDAEGIVCFAEENTISKSDLINLNNRLRSALKVDLVRGASTLNEVEERVLENVINELTALLLPGEIPENISQLKHLIIIPEYNIGQFPFYMLQPYNSQSYIIDLLSISIAPTMMDEKKFSDFFSNEYIGYELSFSFENPLIVGNPTYTDQSSFYFQNLPGAEIEAIFVADMTGCKAIIGNDAKKTSIQKKAAKSDFMYFATHAVTNFNNPLDSSFIVFAPDNSNLKGFWTAREIQQSEINAEMVVLSACQTGLGKSHEGGTIGLSRAFFLAGVYHTIMSLWSVNDEATKELMKLYIKNLQDPFTNMKEPHIYYPAEHLRQAILEYRETNSNPAHWASFSLFGYPF